jgi:hypothetical protein
MQSTVPQKNHWCVNWSDVFGKQGASRLMVCPRKRSLLYSVRGARWDVDRCGPTSVRIRIADASIVQFRDRAQAGSAGATASGPVFKTISPARLRSQWCAVPGVCNFAALPPNAVLSWGTHGHLGLVLDKALTGGCHGIEFFAKLGEEHPASALRSLARACLDGSAALFIGDDDTLTIAASPSEVLTRPTARTSFQ